MKPRFTFAEWLEEQLAEKEWSPADLARRSKVSPAHLSRMLTGVRPGPDALRKLARALDLPAEVVFRKAGLLPPTKEEMDELEREWQHLFDLAETNEDREELLDRARFELQRIRERNARYKED